MLYPKFYSVHFLFLNEYKYRLTFSISTSNIEASKPIRDLLIRYNCLETRDVEDC